MDVQLVRGAEYLWRLAVLTGRGGGVGLGNWGGGITRFSKKELCMGVSPGQNKWPL